MVANLAIVKTAHEKLACKHGASLHLQRAACPSGALPRLPHDDHMLYLSNSWPLDLHEDLLHPNIINSGKVPALPPQLVSGSPLSSHAQHCYKQQPRPYFLSSHPRRSSSRSAISSSTSANTTPTSTSSQSPTSSDSPPAASHPIQQFTSLWDGEDEDASGKDRAYQRQFPPLDPCDHMKALLTLLGSCISSITTAYARQQAALHSHNLQAAIDGEGGRPTVAVISATDKAMVEALGNLSRLHSQLVLLPRKLPFKELEADGGHAEGEHSTITTTLQLRRYEGIITRFHDEIRRKDAVTEALKETLAKSMLKGEKLQARVKALEAQLSHSPHESPRPFPLSEGLHLEKLK